jgi:putative DNA primase/helicase
LFYDGRRWKFDAAAEIHAAAKATVRHMSHLAADIKDDDERKRFKKWALESDKRSVRENTVALARYEEGFKALRSEFDQQPWKLNVLNGTVDLKTGKLVAHDRADKLTQLTPVVFDPSARCPRWVQFLSETFPEREEIIPFLQRSVGYTLTGDTSDQHFWLMLGTGRNGKTVFLNVLKALLGEYASETSFATFSAKRNDAAINPRDGLAALRGARFVKASESGEAKRFDDALLKAVTGGDAVRTANMYEQDFSYVPQFKIWLASNHEPQVTDVSDGLWRRMYRINFEHQVAEAKQDIHLPAKLEQELPGILNWALAGLRDYRSGGMQMPVAVASAVAQYRHDQNPLREFFEAKYDLTGNPTDEVVGTELLQQFNGWAKAMRTRALSSNALGMALRGMQIEGRRVSNRKVYAGLKEKQGPVGF